MVVQAYLEKRAGERIKEHAQALADHEEWMLHFQQKLDALYPAGSYAFEVSGSPSQNVTANLPVNAIPNAPQVNNYAAAQAINAGAAFTLAWDPFVGGTAADSITVQVLNASNQVVFQTENAGCPSALPGTARSIDIPAQTLAPACSTLPTVPRSRRMQSTRKMRADPACRPMP